MRKWFASLAVLGIASAATAQTIPQIGTCGQSQAVGFDDGTAENSWKVRNPTGHTDAFNVDFDDIAGNLGMTIEGVAINTNQTSSSGSFGIRYISICPDNLAVSGLGKTPDILNPLSQLGSRGGTVTITGTPNVSAGFCSGFVVYDVPDVSPGTTGGEHAVMSMLSGDSSTWLCSDTTAPSAGRSYFTSTHYTTPAIALTTDFLMRLVGPIATPGGSAYLTVNASQATNSISFSETDNVAVTLWSNAAVQPTLYLQGITVPTFIAIPNLILSTGFENFLSIPDPFQGTICGPAGPPCGFAGATFGFTAFYIDNADLKKNGNGKIKQTNTVACTVTPGYTKFCNPCLCFGQADDGTMDGNIWKVANPAGPADFFSVRMDHADVNGVCADPTNYLSVQAASWDFCGSGPSWATVGIYGASTTLGANTPDLSQVLAQSTTLSMVPFAADFAYPATTYDFPDIAASTNTTIANATVMHVAMQWPLGDSCIWIGSDSFGSSDNFGNDCSRIPGSSSFFSNNGYTTVAGAQTTRNWMMRIDWN